MPEYQETTSAPTITEAEKEDIVIHKSGASSSYCPDYSQIPLEAMTALAQRFELGALKHGKGNWKNGIPDKDYVIQRLNHVIRHAYTMIGKLEGNIPIDGDDDAGALMWGGTFAIVASNIHGLVKK